eukprot:CAMPEP_0184861106 /NCGR_PEP_ID=MMETSP0580-20130426/5873_1 /TAXON_ID=1118495 /ORGANISM="Dactyliosolen fragilissimus" /LENGTH=546 /DNA_ID=CAMNT_0027358485 /DNA_START=28 /DNA_END=1668 /DNA_ORIENTATION=-
MTLLQECHTFTTTTFSSSSWSSIHRRNNEEIIRSFIRPQRNVIQRMVPKEEDEDEDENENEEEIENMHHQAQEESISSLQQKRNVQEIQQQQQKARMEAEIAEAERLSGNVNIPKTGISVSDEAMASQTTRFLTKLEPIALELDDDDNDPSSSSSSSSSSSESSIHKGNHRNPKLNLLTKIRTYASEGGGLEPMRYLVATSPPPTMDTEIIDYVMIDIPPYSDQLVQDIHNFMNHRNHVENENESEKENAESSSSSPSSLPKGRLVAILTTSMSAIHYDESSAVYVTRKSDLLHWKKAFPQMEIIMYRLDTPRDCKDIVTQSLDGYGPWAMTQTTTVDDDNNNDNDNLDKKWTFKETGRPLTILEWDEDTQKRVLDNGEIPPDDQEENDNNENEEEEDQLLYTPQAIRQREENKDILAIYTPGHTPGSLTYIFPKMNLCFSGYAIPLEDSRTSSNTAGGANTAGPALDYRGYITTNRAGIDRQVQSARHVICTYGDRFDTILPCSSDGLSLEMMSNHEDRVGALLNLLRQYEELGQIYEKLGILSQ